MNGYKVFYNERSIEVYAETMMQAKEKAIAILKPPKSKQHMVTVVLCKKNGETVIHSTTEFG